MHNSALDLVQMLVDAGATPGQDFSYGSNRDCCSITEHGLTLLKQYYPDIDWDDFVLQVELDPQQPIDALHNYLGVDFIGRVLQFIDLRLNELPPPNAAWYLQQVLVGVEKKTGIALYQQLMQRSSLERQIRIEGLLSLEAIAQPCHLWIRDLVVSAGGTDEDVTVENDDAFLTERGLRLFAAVWAGELNLYDVLAQDK